MRASVIVERRSLASAPRFTAKPDDAAQLQDLIETMRNVPRDSMASMPDMLFLMRRLSGRLAAIAGRLERVEPQAPSCTRTRARGTMQADRDAIIAGVFGKAPRRDQVRMVTTRAGRSVRVVERSSRQMELNL